MRLEFVLECFKLLLDRHFLMPIRLKAFCGGHNEVLKFRKLT